MNKDRGFEKVSRVKEDDNFVLPRRMTKHSVGYDFFSPINAEIKPNNFLKIKTGIKVYFLEDEAFFIYARSGLGSKKGIVLRNNVAVFESDYYNNLENEGEAIITLSNTSNETFTLNKGDRFAQGIFQKVLFAGDEFNTEDLRKGGLGSTTK